ncbi:MAG: hypothetical protein GXP56_03505 [Deltaproteobacteria bacterium]|nr:hypothetical protein [Deltaproteobacteria bacterium]
MKQLIISTYLGMISGLLLSLVLSHSFWIDMRINTSLVLPWCILAGVLAKLYCKNIPLTGLVLIVQGMLILVLLYSYGPDINALSVIPAIQIREGLFLKFMDLSLINFLLVLFILVGNIMLIPFK